MGELASVLRCDVRVAADAESLGLTAEPRVEVEALFAAVGHDELQARYLGIVVVIAPARARGRKGIQGGLGEVQLTGRQVKLPSPVLGACGAGG
jgi:hypothetical protein